MGSMDSNTKADKPSSSPVESNEALAEHAVAPLSDSASVQKISEQNNDAVENEDEEKVSTDRKRPAEDYITSSTAEESGPPPPDKKQYADTNSTLHEASHEEDPNKPLAFPRKLMALLQQEKAPDGIYWLPSGDVFAMQTDKMEDVLNKNFQGTKFMSFTRTLNKWWVHCLGSSFQLKSDREALFTYMKLNLNITWFSGGQLLVLQKMKDSSHILRFVLLFKKCFRGFRKALGLNLPPKTVAYQHQDFLRDAPDKVENIVNHRKGGTKKISSKSDSIAPAIGEDSQLLVGTSSAHLPNGMDQHPSQFATLTHPFGQHTSSFNNQISMKQQQHQQQQQQQQQGFLNQTLLFQSLMRQQHASQQLFQQQQQQHFHHQQQPLDNDQQHQYTQRFIMSQNPCLEPQQQQANIEQESKTLGDTAGAQGADNEERNSEQWPDPNRLSTIIISISEVA